MKNLITFLIVLCSASTILFTSCGTPEQKVAEAKENVKEADKSLAVANTNYLEEVESYKKEVANKTAMNDKHIADFKAAVDKEDNDTKMLYKDTVVVLEEKNAKLKRKMAEFKADSKENWEKFKTDFNQDMKDAGDAFKNTKVKRKDKK